MERKTKKSSKNESVKLNKVHEEDELSLDDYTPTDDHDDMLTLKNLKKRTKTLSLLIKISFLTKLHIWTYLIKIMKKSSITSRN